jgi:hypothetical protein
LPDPRLMPLDRFCHLVWHAMTMNAEDENAVTQLRAKLWIPPEGEEAAGVWAPEAELAAFGALKSALGQ